MDHFLFIWDPPRTAMAVNASSLTSSSRHCSPPIDRPVSKRSSIFSCANSLPKSAVLLHEAPRFVSYACSRKPDSDPGPLSSGDVFGSKRPMEWVENAAPIAPSVSASPPPSSAIDFLTLCHNLKTTKRKGWLNHGIKGPESIADHMYRMALMSLISEDLPGVNRERCIKMALVHDIAEAIVGDITPSDGIPKEEKSRLEQDALNKMCEVLGGGMRAEEIKGLWAEYENNSSLEANVVKDFDKVEMILQALEYEMEHGNVLDEFFLSTEGKIQTEIGRKWAAEITSRRNHLRSANQRK